MWDISSPTRDQTRTPCIGRRSLNHWTAREIPVHSTLDSHFEPRARLASQHVLPDVISHDLDWLLGNRTSERDGGGKGTPRVPVTSPGQGSSLGIPGSGF